MRKKGFWRKENNFAINAVGYSNTTLRAYDEYQDERRFKHR